MWLSRGVDNAKRGADNDIDKSKMETGKWYVSLENGDTVYYNGKNIAEGFCGTTKEWIKLPETNTYDYGFKEADKSDVHKLLNDWADKKYPIGTIFDAMDYKDRTFKVLDDSNAITDSTVIATVRKGVMGEFIFYNGKWANIVKTNTQEEFAKALIAHEVSKFKVGDWVYAEPGSIYDYRRDRYTKAFKIEEINGFTWSTEKYLRPEKGISTGVLAELCRYATQKEINNAIGKELNKKEELDLMRERILLETPAYHIKREDAIKRIKEIDELLGIE
jgi:hypothetical protein